MSNDSIHHRIFHYMGRGLLSKTYGPLLKKFPHVLDEREYQVIEAWTGLDGGGATVNRAAKKAGITTREAVEVCVSGVTKLEKKKTLESLYKKRIRARERLEELELQITLLENS